MNGVRALNQAMMTALAAQATTLAPATDANVIALVIASFSSSESTVLADLTLASGDGLDPIEGVTGTQLVGNNPATNQITITIKEPAGGWHWQLTGTPVAPITVYGYALLKNDLSVLYATAVLPTPVVVSTIGDIVDIGSSTLVLPIGALS